MARCAPTGPTSRPQYRLLWSLPQRGQHRLQLLTADHVPRRALAAAAVRHGAATSRLPGTGCVRDNPLQPCHRRRHPPYCRACRQAQDCSPGLRRRSRLQPVASCDLTKGITSKAMCYIHIAIMEDFGSCQWPDAPPAPSAEQLAGFLVFCRGVRTVSLSLRTKTLAVVRLLAAAINSQRLPSRSTDKPHLSPTGWYQAGPRLVPG